MEYDISLRCSRTNGWSGHIDQVEFSRLLVMRAPFFQSAKYVIIPSRNRIEIEGEAFNWINEQPEVTKNLIRFDMMPEQIAALIMWLRELNWKHEISELRLVPYWRGKLSGDIISAVRLEALRESLQGGGA